MRPPSNHMISNRKFAGAVNVSSAHRHAPDRHRAMPVAPLIPGHARITSFDMWEPSKPLVYGVGTFFVAHYVGAGYGRPHAPDDLLQPPPLAAVVLTCLL